MIVVAKELNWVKQKTENFSIVAGDVISEQLSAVRLGFVVLLAVSLVIGLGTVTWPPKKPEEPKLAQKIPIPAANDAKTSPIEKAKPKSPSVSEKSEQEFQEVDQHLNWRIRPSRDGLHTAFAIVNESSVKLGPYQITCDINFERFEGLRLFKKDREVVTPSTDELEAGGDAETDQCIELFGSPTPLICSDVTANFNYVLTDQPNKPRKKQIRAYIHKDGNDYVWDQEPINSSETFCN